MPVSSAATRTLKTRPTAPPSPSPSKKPGTAASFPDGEVTRAVTSRSNGLGSPALPSYERLASRTISAVPNCSTAAAGTAARLRRAIAVAIAAMKSVATVFVIYSFGF